MAAENTFGIHAAHAHIPLPDFEPSLLEVFAIISTLGRQVGDCNFKVPSLSKIAASQSLCTLFSFDIIITLIAWNFCQKREIVSKIMDCNRPIISAAS